MELLSDTGKEGYIIWQHTYILTEEYIKQQAVAVARLFFPVNIQHVLANIF